MGPSLIIQTHLAMTYNFFCRENGHVASPEMSKMNQRLSFSKPRGYTLCSSLEKRREDCWSLCPTWPRFYKREKKQKMVEVRRGGQGREGQAVWVGRRGDVRLWERQGGR